MQHTAVPDNTGEHVGSHLSRLPSSFHCLLRDMFEKPLSILSEEINLQGLQQRHKKGEENCEK